MNQEQAIFENILFNQVLVVPEWQRLSSVLVDAGISSINALAAAPDETINNLRIPMAPLDLLKKLKQQLKTIGERDRDTNAFSQPLCENSLIRDFSFAPCFDPLDYIRDIHGMTNKEAQMNMVINKVSTIEIGGLTRHQAIMIALYCQESDTQQASFYYLLNRALRERTNDFLLFRPSLYLLDSGLRSLPPVTKVTWRGQNYPPDLNKFIVGRVVCFSGLCSTSEDKQSTLAFMGKVPASGIHSRTLFKLFIEYGYSIQHFSPYSNEKEIVAGFCSRWTVRDVKFNHLEDFGHIGNYRCDVYIELQQLPYEPIFDTTTDSLSGLYLLSNIQTSRLPLIPNDFKLQFINLFDMLKNDDARTILLEYLRDVWNVERNCFRGDITDTQAMHIVLNFLKPVEDLRDALTHNGTNIQQCLLLCQQNKIYSQLNLFFTDNRERTVEEFQALGFTMDDAEKLYDQMGNKQLLLMLYPKVNGLEGTAENPRNVAKWLKEKRLQHYMYRDGMMVGLYVALQSVYNTAICCNGGCFPGAKEICRITFNRGCTILQRGDLYIALALCTLQLSGYLLQWWYGDITSKQLIKSIVVDFLTIGAGLAAAFFTIAAAPAGIIGIFLGFVAGTIAGVSVESITRQIVESILPDGYIEEVNAKRLLYHRSLQVLNCSFNDTWHQIQTKYRQMALIYHPDKREDKDPSQFQTIVAAYEIVKTYNETLNAACQRLKITHETLSRETLADWHRVGRKSMRACPEVDLSYEILNRHVNYTSRDWQWLREKLNIHHAANVSNAGKNQAVLPLP